MLPAIFFLLTLATLGALAWSGAALLRGTEDPLGARLEELQALSPSAGARRAVRRRGGVLNSVLYAISLVPGGEDWLRETEQELAYAGMRQRWAAGAYALFQLAFLFLALGTMAYLQRANDGLSQLIGREPDPQAAFQVAEDCQDMLDRLSDTILRAIALWKMEGFTTEEIASKLGCTTRTIERKLQLIRRLWVRGDGSR